MLLNRPTHIVRIKYIRGMTHSGHIKSTESGFCMFSGVDSSRVYGTASSSSRLKVAEDLFKHLFVTGFDKDSTPEDVMQHLQYNKIRFRFVKKMTKMMTKELRSN